MRKALQSTPSWKSEKTPEDLLDGFTEKVKELFGLVSKLQERPWIQEHAPSKPDALDKRISKVSNKVVDLKHSPGNWDTKKQRYLIIKEELEEIETELKELEELGGGLLPT